MAPTDGERYVCVWLRLRGWRVLARNWRTRGGEIDVVAARGRVLRFVEVKARRHDPGDPPLHPAQVTRLLRAAQVYRMAHPHLRGLHPRLDAVVVSGRWPSRRLRWWPIGHDDAHDAPDDGSPWAW